MVHTQHKSLKDTYLPDISDFGIASNGSKGKNILVCFFDYYQRPSRNCIIQLSKRIQELKSQGIEIIAVHASKTEKAKLNEWAKENNISFPIGIIERDEEQTHLNWGVQSLPWLILTDKNHVVRVEGFVYSDLNEKIKEIENAKN